MPKKGFDSAKIKKILKALKEHPEGLWVRELSRKTGLSKSTVSRYLNKALTEEVDFRFFGRNKMVKLKGE